MAGFGKIKGGISLPGTTAANSAVYGIYTAAEAEAYRKLGRWPTEPTVPGAPIEVSSVAGNAQVILTWSAPANNGGASITDYAIQYSSNSGATWTTFTDSVSTATTATVTGLTNGSAHTFRVAAVNGIGTGAYSTASAAVTPTAGDQFFSNVQLLLPGDASTADASSYSRSVTASGAAVSTSQKKFGAGSIAISGSGQYLAVASNTALNMSGDFVIEFWVRLANATAQGWWLGGPQNANGYMMGGFNLSGSGQLWLGGANTNWPVQFSGLSLQNDTWHHIAIARSGSSNRLYVDGSQVGSTITDSTSWVVNPSAVWIGSQAGGSSMNGFIDDFRWTVGSARGMTGATITVPTAAFPDSGPMFAPTSLTATGGNAQVSLAWTAPSYNGGSAITGYTVEYTPSGGSAQTVSTGSSSASYTLTGLTNGTAYTVRVAAVNAAGTGSYTAASSSVTPAGQVFRAIPTLTSNNSNGVAEANTGTTANAFLLFDGSTSSQYLTRRNDSDTPKRYFQYTFANGLKSLIGGYTMSPSDAWYDSVHRWELSGSNDGSTFTTLDTRVVSWAGPSEVKTFTLAAPANFSTYRWTLTPDGNDAFAGLSAVQLTAVPVVTPPAAPTSLTATAGNAQASLAWTAPSDNGGSAITDYSVQFSTDSGSTWSTFSRTASTTASQVVTSLTNGTAYVFRVAGINANGTGTYTAASSSVTPSASALVKLAGNYTGLGTQASPYTGSTIAYPLFRADVAGTLYYTATGYNVAGDYGASELRVNNAVVTGAITYEQNEGLGFSGNRAVAVGDVIGLGGSNWGGMSLSIHLRP
jgi:hypothetical protein